MRFIACVFSITLLLGCESHEREHSLVSQVDSTPLELDPTEPIELGEWWTNGKQLLRLNDDASYAVYDSMSRYRPASERGRWAQTSYAVLWLEPYDKRQPERLRVSIRRDEGDLALVIPRVGVMRAIDQPPAVIEDRLLGNWEGAKGSLMLGSDMRYTWTDSSTPAAGEPVAHAGQRGVWRVTDNQVVLQPTAPGGASIRMSIETRQNDLILHASAAGDILTQSAKVTIHE